MQEKRSPDIDPGFCHGLTYYMEVGTVEAVDRSSTLCPVFGLSQGNDMVSLHWCSLC